MTTYLNTALNSVNAVVAALVSLLQVVDFVLKTINKKTEVMLTVML